MPKLVVNLAVIACEAGTMASTFLPDNAATITASPSEIPGTMNDFVVGANIDTFGICRADPKKKPCKPVTPFPWSFTVVRLPLVGQPAITDASQLTCVKFGKNKISVLNAGQFEIDVPDAPTCKPPEEEGGISGLIGGLLDDIMMTDVANAPAPEDCIIPGKSALERVKPYIEFIIDASPVGTGVGVAKTLNYARKGEWRNAAIEGGGIVSGKIPGGRRAVRNAVRKSDNKLHGPAPNPQRRYDPESGESIRDYRESLKAGRQRRDNLEKNIKRSERLLEATKGEAFKRPVKQGTEDDK